MKTITLKQYKSREKLKPVLKLMTGRPYEGLPKKHKVAFNKNPRVYLFAFLNHLRKKEMEMFLNGGKGSFGNTIGMLTPMVNNNEAIV